MNKLVELNNISKAFTGENVLHNISFSINKKQITAILGENGTGKSTLLRIIAGVERPGKGKVDYPNKEIKIGYVPERFPKNIRFTPSEYLLYMGKMSGASHEYLTKRIAELLHRFQLDKMNDKRMLGLSKGNTQKIGIIQAILQKPDLLILDEPLSGLDSQAQEELVKIIGELKQEGAGILLTYHEANTFEAIVERTLYLHAGNISEQPFEKEKVKLIIVRNIEKSSIEEWDEIVQEEEKDNRLFLSVPVGKSDAILSRVLQLGGSIDSVSTVFAEDGLEKKR